VNKEEHCISFAALFKKFVCIPIEEDEAKLVEQEIAKSAEKYE
jgi:hypothetical protein